MEATLVCALRSTYDICRAPMARGPNGSGYFPRTWASDIKVELFCSDNVFLDKLLIKGWRPVIGSDFQPSRDPYLQYTRSLRSSFAQTGAKESPHIRFANSISDLELTEFLRHFGPWAPIDIRQREGPPELDWRIVVEALEDLPTLRTEQQTFAAALQLIMELRAGEKGADPTFLRQQIIKIAEGIATWPEQWEREERWRDSFSPMPWHFDRNHRDYVWRMRWAVCSPDQPKPSSVRLEELDWRMRALVESASRPTPSAYRAGHLLLCELINAFPTELQFEDPYVVETLSPSAWIFGIRPIMYLILRHEYLGREGLGRCQNDRCRRFFESSRAGQKFCSPECSQKFRQRDYWTKWGAELRRSRKAPNKLQKRKR